MSLFAQIKQDRMKAMKAREAQTKDVLTALVGDLEILAKNLGQDAPTDEQAVKKIKSYVENAKSNMGLTTDSVKKDAYAFEAELLSDYLPKQLDDDVLRAAIKDLAFGLDVSGKQAIGPIMKGLKDKFSGQFDGKRASEIIREEV